MKYVMQAVCLFLFDLNVNQSRHFLKEKQGHQLTDTLKLMLAVCLFLFYYYLNVNQSRRFFKGKTGSPTHV